MCRLESVVHALRDRHGRYSFLVDLQYMCGGFHQL